MKRLRDLNHGGFRDTCSEEREKAECGERVECAEWTELELGSRKLHARIERRTAL